MIKPRISMGGFAVARGPSESLAIFKHRAEDGGASSLFLAEDALMMAAWPEFEGQGMWHDGRVAIAFDTDLTNIDELRDYLCLPRDGAGQDLGRLMVELYRHEGINFLDRLRGQFAFALWDGVEQKLFVATDFYGIRPVVHTRGSEPFVAASRIRQLLCYPGISREIDPEGIYHYLFFQAICSPVSIYQDIRKLDPGTLLTLEPRGLSLRQYYDIAYNPRDQVKEEQWVARIPREIEQAVARFAPCSNPETTGCFLSGGTDSSSVSGFYTKIAGRPTRTFSIGFAEPKYNELEYAHIAARHFGTLQHDYQVTPGDVTVLLENLPYLYDEPFGNASVVPAYYCALLAKQNGVDVLLGGDGGDEIFGGNERYVTNLVFERYFSLPRIFREALLEPVVNRFSQKGIFRRASSYIRRAKIPNPDRFFSYNLLAEVSPNTVFQGDYLSRCDPGCFMDLARSHYRNAAPAHDTDRLLYIDMKFTITDNDLRKVTVMAESAGIRVRYPLLDRDLVDFSTTIPATYKVKPGKNRYIFKRAMKGLLPSEIIAKSKHGMGLPIATWFRKDPLLSALMHDVLFSGRPSLLEYVRPGFMEFLRSNFRQDETSYFGDTLWVYLMLELWLRTN